MRDIPGFEDAGRDWWIEDSVTQALRAAKPKVAPIRLTDEQAGAIIDKMLADQKREREERANAR